MSPAAGRPSAGSSRLAALRQSGLRRLGELRFDLGELSGALGDLGTFIPLVVAMIVVGGLDAGTVLFFAGLSNVVTGLLFNQPVPVQPMKAIAAVAIAEGLSPGSIAAAGFTVGALVLLLAGSGLVERVERVVPRPVVRGIQLGVGLKLAEKGLEMALQLELWGPDSGFVAVVGAVLVLATQRWRRFPAALVLFAGGWLLLAGRGGGVASPLHWGWSGPHWLWPSLEEWRTGLVRGALPQLPLTLLNSVVAVCALSGDLFPGRAIATRAMAWSVGLMNVGGCLLGAMPSCHGSGGLAGQYRFGARSGGSVVVLGAAKMAAALLLGASAVSWLAIYPQSVLAVLLAFAGVELALPARECRDRDSFLVAASTAAGVTAANTALGCAIGLAVAALLAAARRRG